MASFITIITSKVMCSAQAVDKAATGYSTAIDFRRCTGETAVLLKTTAGTIAVTQQCSVDNVNWYDPTDALDIAVGSVVAAQTVSTGRWIAFSPVPCNYLRFKIVEANSAATVVTLTLIDREQA